MAPDRLRLIPADINETTAPLFLGYTATWALYGALCVQTYIYHVSFPKDRAISKIMIHGLFALETLQTVLLTTDMFSVFAAHYGDVANLRDIHTLWLSVPVLTGLIECIVQLFYSYRVSVLSGSKVFGCAIASIALASFVAAILDGVLQFRHGLYSHIARELSLAPCVVWLAGSALCDVIIAATQTYYLVKMDVAFKATRNRITRLVRLTIETGILTATGATIVLVFLAVNEETYNTGPAFYLSKLYTNALLMVFNSRARIEQSQAVLVTGAGIFFAHRDSNVGVNTSFSAPERHSTQTIRPPAKDSEAAIEVSTENSPQPTTKNSEQPPHYGGHSPERSDSVSTLQGPPAYRYSPEDSPPGTPHSYGFGGDREKALSGRIRSASGRSRPGTSESSRSLTGSSVHSPLRDTFSRPGTAESSQTLSPVRDAFDNVAIPPRGRLRSDSRPGTAPAGPVDQSSQWFDSQYVPVRRAPSTPWINRQLARAPSLDTSGIMNTGNIEKAQSVQEGKQTGVAL